MKNSNDTIGNRTRYLPTCSAMPQPTARPCAPGTFLRNPIYVRLVFPVHVVFVTCRTKCQCLVTHKAIFFVNGL